MLSPQQFIKRVGSKLRNISEKLLKKGFLLYINWNSNDSACRSVLVAFTSCRVATLVIEIRYNLWKS